MSKVQVTVKKGPNFKVAEAKAYQYLHGLLLEKGKELHARKTEEQEGKAI